MPEDVGRRELALASRTRTLRNMRPKRGVMRNQDSLDLLGRQDRVLEQLFEAWRSDDPEGCDRGSKTKANWERGTVAKLILEQGALRIAALEDVVRTLRLCHQGELAEEAGNFDPRGQALPGSHRRVLQRGHGPRSPVLEHVERIHREAPEPLDRRHAAGKRQHCRPLLKRSDPSVSGCAVPYISVPMHPSIHPYISVGTTRSH